MLKMLLGEKIEVAEFLHPGNDNGDLLSLIKSDPVYSNEDRQKVYDYIESICQSFQEEDVIQGSVMGQN